MRLSEAIRLGATLKPQGRLYLYHNGRTCALGAALDAVGQLPRRSDLEEGYRCARREWPFLEYAEVLHPVFQGTYPLKEVIWSLNDSQGWTREQIADFIATVEPAEEPQPEVKGVEETLSV